MEGRIKKGREGELKKKGKENGKKNKEGKGREGELKKKGKGIGKKKKVEKERRMEERIK